MSYLHIDNLYKDQAILQFRECYAMEKIHGTSAHVRFTRETVMPSCVGEEHLGDYPVARITEKVAFFSGGEKRERFVALFDEGQLKRQFCQLFSEDTVTVVVYGEAYGGKCQGMKDTYGAALRFVAFEVKVGESWLSVPQAEEVVSKLGLDFVPYKRIIASLDIIDTERDADSVQAVKNGMGEGHMREGVVLRPVFELRRNNGSRIIAKHKRPEFSETATVRKVKPETAQLIEEADGVAREFVTVERMRHVIDALIEKDIMCHEFRYDITETGKVVTGMIEDVVREGAGEFLDTREVRKAIGTASAKLYKRLIGGQFAKELLLGHLFSGKEVSND